MRYMLNNIITSVVFISSFIFCIFTANVCVAKDDSIPSSFSKSLDFNSLDEKSNDIRDFGNISKNFYITAHDLDNSDSYKTPLTLSRGISLGLYYGCRTVVDTVCLPLYALDYVEDGFARSYVDLLLISDTNYDDLLEGEPLYIRDLGEKVAWDKFKNIIQRGTNSGIYIETRNFSYNLLRKYYFETGMNKTTDSERKNVYVFISNSPSIPIKIFLDSLQSRSFLIKDMWMRYSLKNSVFVDIPYSFDLLDRDLEDKDIFEHFSKYLDPNIIEGNNLIFVDLAWDGTTIGSFMRSFKRYLASLGVNEHELYATINTFFPEGLRTNFLNQLSTLKNIDVEYSREYFTFLMKNLFFMRYDNTLSLYFKYQDSAYKWYRTYYTLSPGFINAIGGGSRVLKRFENSSYTDMRHASEKTRYPYSDYDEQNSEYKGFHLVYNYDRNWKQTIKTTDIASVSSHVSDFQQYYTDSIEHDPSLVKRSLCSILFAK